MALAWGPATREARGYVKRLQRWNMTGMAGSASCGPLQGETKYSYTVRRRRETDDAVEAFAVTFASKAARDPPSHRLDSRLGVVRRKPQRK